MSLDITHAIDATCHARRWEHPVAKRADGTLRCRFWRDTDDGRTIGCSHVHTSSKKQKMPGGEAFVWLQPGVELQWREAVLERDTAARAAAFQASGTASASPTWTSVNSKKISTTFRSVRRRERRWSMAVNACHEILPGFT